MRRRDVYYERRTLLRKRYGFWAFVFDAVMTMITGGFWLIWVFVREMRNR